MANHEINLKTFPSNQDQDEKCQPLITQSSVEKMNETNLTVKKNSLINTHDLKILGNAFIERDYSSGWSNHVIFETNKHPAKLLDRIEKDVLESCIREINLIYSTLNKQHFIYFLESLFMFLTFFLFSSKLCRYTYYDKQIKRLNELIDSQNLDVFLPRGLQILSPMRNGMRNLQIVIYDIEHYLLENETKELQKELELQRIKAEREILKNHRDRTHSNQQSALQKIRDQENAQGNYATSTLAQKRLREDANIIVQSPQINSNFVNNINQKSMSQISNTPIISGPPSRNYRGPEVR